MTRGNRNNPLVSDDLNLPQFFDKFYQKNESFRRGSEINLDFPNLIKGYSAIPNSTNFFFNLATSVYSFKKLLDNFWILNLLFSLFLG